MKDDGNRQEPEPWEPSHGAFLRDAPWCRAQGLWLRQARKLARLSNAMVVVLL